MHHFQTAAANAHGTEFHIHEDLVLSVCGNPLVILNQYPVFTGDFHDGLSGNSFCAQGRLFPYLVGIGIERFVLEKHLIYAKSKSDAYYAGLKYFHPDKGFDYVSVTRIKKGDVAKYEQFR